MGRPVSSVDFLSRSMRVLCEWGREYLLQCGPKLLGGSVPLEEGPFSVVVASTSGNVGFCIRKEFFLVLGVRRPAGIVA